LPVACLSEEEIPITGAARSGIGFLSADGVFLISGIILLKTIDAGGDP